MVKLEWYYFPRRDSKVRVLFEKISFVCDNLKIILNSGAIRHSVEVRKGTANLIFPQKYEKLNWQIQLTNLFQQAI